MPAVLIQQTREAISSGNIAMAASNIIRLQLQYGKSADARHFCFGVICDPGLLPSLMNEWTSQFNQQIISEGELIVLARMLRRAGMADEAICYYTNVFKRISALPATPGMDPLMHEAAYNLAWLYCSTGQADEIVHYLSHLKEVTAFAGSRVAGMCYATAGRCYFETGEMPKAFSCFQEAIGYRTGYWEYYYEQALVLQFLGDYQEARKSLDKAYMSVPRDALSDKAEIFYLQGEIAMLLHEPYMARDRFLDAVALNSDMVYGYHSLFNVYRTLGDFSKARHYLKMAFKLYSKEWTGNCFENDTGKCYYYAELIGNSQCKLTTKDFELWELLLMKYYEYEPSDPDAAGEMFKMFLTKKRAIEDGDILADNWHGEKLFKLEEVYARVQEWYSRSVGNFETAIKQALYENKRKELYVQLGRLYLSFEIYEKACESFLEALRITPSDVSALEGAGVAYFKSGNYEEAIRQFRRALLRYEGSLNIQCNLADSYRCGGKMEDAEMIYRKVLKVCPNYLDALIGMGECKKTSGDKALEADQKADAELYFQEAKVYFLKALGQREVDNSSRLLTATEQNALYYSSGYTRARLYEISGGLNFAVLWGARNDLSMVKENFPEYLKSQKAIRLINRRAIERPARKLSSSLIFILAFTLFIFMQFRFYKNYTRKDEKVFVLSGDAILTAGKKAAKDSAILVNAVSPLLLKEFASLKQLEDRVSSVVDPKLLAFIDMKSVIKKDLPANVEWSDVTYATFTFGSLLFMIIGLFLPSITSIKLGSIQMDKAAVETVKASSRILTK